ncbi:MAG TPA: YciI family protein [Bacteroidota bacterium]|nr:YciI family protein [Bacteroidota bacterium]
MNEYMFFIRKKSKSETTLSAERHQEFLKSCESYIGKLKSEGKLVSAQPIQWQGGILTYVQNSWGQAPIDEHGEVIGGYYHIRAADLEEALRIARENPEFQFNPETRIEVRPLKMKEQSTGFSYPSQA